MSPLRSPWLSRSEVAVAVAVAVVVDVAVEVAVAVAVAVEVEVAVAVAVAVAVGVAVLVAMVVEVCGREWRSQSWLGLGRGMRCCRGRCRGRSTRPAYDAVVGAIREQLLHTVRMTVPTNDAPLLRVADIADLTVVVCRTTIAAGLTNLPGRVRNR